MKFLSNDIETYSSNNISKSGAHKYTQAPDFDIMMAAYAMDDEPVEIIDLWDEIDEKFMPLPEWYVKCLFDDNIQKSAYNAAFEKAGYLAHFKKHFPELGPLHLEQWECTMAKASLLSLPLGLARGAAALRLPVDKDPIGKALIKYFCEPCKPTKANGMRTRNLPHHDYEKWEAFKRYCKKDVEVERAMRKKLEFLQPTDFERRVWELDQRINGRGVLINRRLVTQALRINQDHADELMERAREITGLNNPNSTAQLLKWLNENTDIEDEVENLKKDTVTDLLTGIPEGDTKRILEIRQELAKSSIKKYQAMAAGMGYDDRIRGLLQYGGATRTMRFAGRLLQLQNLPKTYLQDLDLARVCALEGDRDMLKMLFGNVPDTMSQLIRTCIIPPAGRKLLVSDFAAIEARVLAWLAGEDWKLEVFRGHGKIYEAVAAQMFKVPFESIKKPSKYRDMGKVGELSCGFQGGVNALIKMGALKNGLTEDELPGVKDAWRAANPKIVKLWYDMNDAAITCVRTGVTQTVGCITFRMIKGSLFMYLPSGRPIVYLRPKLEPNQFGSDSITYEGMNQITGKWERSSTYGGKLVENAVQSMARDALCTKMIDLDFLGFYIIFHVHDEVILEIEENDTQSQALELVNEIMALPIDWAPGLPLKGDSFITDYYKKD